MRTVKLGPLAITGWLAFAGCTDSELFVPPLNLDSAPDNRIEVQGRVCAQSADELEAFLKVMIIVDRSNSMLVTDPNNQRISAAQDLVLRFIEDPVSLRLRRGVEFALISFFGNVVVHTRNTEGLPGFSNDGPQILFSLAQIARTVANTGYDKALNQAFLLLDQDMARLSNTARARSRYEVIFLSDGLPFPDNCPGESNSPAAAVAGAGRIAALSALHRVPVTFNTAFASDPRMFELGNFVDGCSGNPTPDPNRSIGQETRALLQDMANEGRGTFTQFNNGDAITFEGFEFSEARRIFALSNFIASNVHARPAGDRMLPDSDADGLTDIDEAHLGSSPYLADSDGDGFSDGVEWRFRLSGFDPLDPTDARCSDIDRVDTDFDGLLDCEEIFLGTLRRSFDSDADGIPDAVEVSFGTDPNSANALQDRQSDADSDGGTNADELRWHTDPQVDDVSDRTRIAYRYEQNELPITDGRACYDFRVGNISLVSATSAPADQTPTGQSPPPGRNRILLHFAETPYDEPLSEPTYRLACVDTRYVADRDLKIPADGVVAIPERRPSDTYRASAVLRPNNSVCYASVNQDCGLNSLWCRYAADGSCNCFRPPQNAGDPVNGTPVGACPTCANGIDDDGDGLTDFPYDPDCFDSIDNDEGSTTACANGVDDDGDGAVDWPFDPGCDSAYDLDETSPTTMPQCADGIDNDGDGAIDHPNDPGCYATADNDESESLTNPVSDCADGFDNDGDGLVDFPADPGCFDANDIDEDGPQVCFFCEEITTNRPGQCDLGTSRCRARSGIPDAGSCTSFEDCRGGVCDTSTGRCRPCVRDRDCDTAPGSGDGLCEPSKGWCLRDAYTPTACTSDTDCPGGGCDVALGFCNVDPYFGCRDTRDCRPDQLCSENRGFCLEPVFATAPCDVDTPCAAGVCDLQQGFCLPQQGSEQCNQDDECPFGQCINASYCDQPTFVPPEQFRPEVDCRLAP